jgi:cytochrome P450
VTPSAHTEEFFNPFNPVHIADPDDYLHASRRSCPVAPVSDGLYTVASDQAVREVLDDTRHFSNRGNFSVGPEDLGFPYPFVSETDPPVHTALRARLMKDLAPARLRKLRPQIERIVTDTIERLPRTGRAELYADYIHFIPVAALYTLIGIPGSDWSYVENLSDAIVAQLPVPLTELPEYAELTNHIGRLVEERRAHPDDRRGDVLDNLCFAEAVETDMPDAEVVTHLVQLLAAATDTTRALITNCVYRLLEQRSQWQAVLADRSLLSNAIEESLRFDAPVQFVVRTAVDDVAIGGCPIDTDKKVCLSLQSANHDEQTWGDEARSFRVDRPNAIGHLSFGRGIHACIGAPVARIEAALTIGALLDRYPDMTLDPSARWVKCKGGLVRRVESLPVLLTGDPS